MRVLQIEDTAVISQTTEMMLTAQGFVVVSTDLGLDGVELAKLYDFDVILLDLGLPDIGGLEVLVKLRSAKIDTPVLVVSGDTSMDTKVLVFERGADDFLAKPWHRDELVARMNALVRRRHGLTDSRITMGNTVFNLARKTLMINDLAVHLTRKEYDLLELLVLRRDATLTRDMMFNHLYGGIDEPEIKILDVYMFKLRKKLRSAGADVSIETIWGRGYTLRTPAQKALAA